LSNFLKDFYNIPNRECIGEYLNKYNLNKIICEIGVNAGNNFLHLLKTAHPILFYGIDIWTDQNSKTSNEDLDKFYKNLKQIESVNSHIKIIKKFSINASMGFPDNFFDFIYIDADHTYESVKEDINAWWPKIKMNGILSGHDYKRKRGCGVLGAVDEFKSTNKIQHFHITPERCSSWMFFKI